MDTHAAHPPLAGRMFTLATDLDGTFLGGSDADRARLYAWIEANRATVGLIFVTGRDPAFIMEEVGANRLPRPDYVVGDVGTTIAKVVGAAEIEIIEDLEAEIAAAWGNGSDTVPVALDGHPGLTPQDMAFRHRASFHMDPDALTHDSAKTIEAMGYDVLISDNRYFDVLPRGVSKGPSLRRLLDHLGVPGERVLTAGDTLNDLSMLTCGLPAVAVGGSEQPLIDRVASDRAVYKAAAIGAAGIAEAIDALNMHPSAREAFHG